MMHPMHRHGHHGHGGQMTPEQQRQMIEQEIRLAKNLGQIKHKIVVMSGKGGVGKSTVAANIAETLQKLGYKTGILDADIHGPNIPKMLGIELYGEEFNEYQFNTFKELTEGAMAKETFANDEEQGEFIKAKQEEYKHSMFPVVTPSGLKVMSMAFLLDSIDTPIIWRGPQKTGAIKQLISDVYWGQLDYLIIDNPPGTGDEPLTVLQTIPEHSPEEEASLKKKGGLNDKNVRIMTPMEWGRLQGFVDYGFDDFAFPDDVPES